MIDKQKRARSHLPAVRAWQPILVAIVSAIGGIAAGYFANSQQQQQPQEEAQHWLIVKGVSGVGGSYDASVRLVVRVNSVPFAYPVFATMAQIEPAMPEMRIPLPCGTDEYIIAFEGTLDAPRLGGVAELRSREATRFRKGHLPDALQQYELLVTTRSSPRYIDSARPRVLYSFQ